MFSSPTRVSNGGKEADRLVLLMLGRDDLLPLVYLNSIRGSVGH